jgi:hypothetical protein
MASMRRRFSFASVLGWLLAIAIGCSGKPGDHGHEQGRNGGIIVSLGSDHYHAEALFEAGGKFKLFMLDHDQAQVLAVPTQELNGYLRVPGRAAAIQLKLTPEPQRGDGPGQTSLFVGKVPPEVVGRELIVIVPNIEIAGKRYNFSFTTEADENGPPMPAKITDDAERDLYLSAGGRYTQADIEANGAQTASQKYAGFHSAHDPNPKPGDYICPITATKANPDCTWTVGGETYQFCCPPCIDEFVQRAKTQTDALSPARTYMK